MDPESACMNYEETVNKMLPPENAIIIKGDRNSIITLEKEGTFINIVREVNGVSNTTRIQTKAFRFIYFEDVVDCDVDIKCKLLRIMINDCARLNCNITSSVVAMFEMYKCADISCIINNPVPFLRIENCIDMTIDQRHGEVCYIVKESANVLVSHSEITRQIGKHLWEGGEQHYIKFNKRELVKHVTMYPLNNVSLSFQE